MPLLSSLRSRVNATALATLVPLASGVGAVRADGQPDALAVLAPASDIPLGLDWRPAETPLPFAVDERTVALGRRLFFDPRLSRSGAMSCATCHRPELAFTDGRALPTGDAGDVGSRNVPTLLNRALGRRHFWDGRAADLAQQALGPMLAANEMALTPELFAARFTDREAIAGFQDAYGAAPSLERAAAAIAAFEVTLVTAAAPFDRYEWEGDASALSAAQVRGLALFRGKAGCSTCHVGPNLTDESFHNLGVGAERGFLDGGRERISGSAADRGAFKTPSLRNVARTAPYMHDGSVATLGDVLTFYDEGGRPNPWLDREIRPLGLLESERADLEAFLHGLTGEVRALQPSLFAAEQEP